MGRPNAKRLATLCLAIALAGMLGGCATAGNPKDPLENYNRAMFAFNDTVDSAIVKPAAKGYQAVLPQTARNGIANFFSNIEDIYIAANDLLQGKLPQAINDTGRVLVNSTLGVFGFMDVASELGVPKRTQDFGLTLAHWGVGSGPYVVLPFFGGRTTRGAFGLVLDLKGDAVGNLPDVPVRNTLLATRVLSERVRLFPVDRIVNEAALDRYAYIRDAYLQHRRNLVKEDNAPAKDDSGAAADPHGKTRGIAARPGAAKESPTTVSSSAMTMVVHAGTHKNGQRR